MDILGCKRTKLFDLLSNGTLERAPRYGREIRILKDSVERALRPAPKRGRPRKVRRNETPIANPDEVPL